MSLIILDRTETLDNEQRQFAQRRFQFALSRFDSRINRVEVTICHRVLPGVASRHECHVVVELKRAGDVVVVEQDADMHACLSRAAQRTGRAVGRSVDLAWDTSDQLHTVISRTL